MYNDQVIEKIAEEWITQQNRFKPGKLKKPDEIREFAKWLDYFIESGDEEVNAKA